MTISSLQGTAICSITGKLYTLKLGILVHKRKFTGKEHDEIIYYMYIVCWIVGTISVILLEINIVKSYILHDGTLFKKKYP